MTAEELAQIKAEIKEAIRGSGHVDLHELNDLYNSFMQADAKSDSSSSSTTSSGGNTSSQTSGLSESTSSPSSAASNPRKALLRA